MPSIRLLDQDLSKKQIANILAAFLTEWWYQGGEDGKKAESFMQRQGIKFEVKK